MSRRALALSSLIVVALFGPIASRSAGQAIGLQVFDDINFRGASATLIADAPDLRQNHLDGRISSLRVAPGEVWQVCTEPNYQGRCEVFSDDRNDLRRGNWNDAIMSARRVRGGNQGRFGGGTRGGFGQPANELNRIELFAGTQFTGQRLVLDAQEMNLRRQNFNDRASSLRIPPGQAWEVCMNADFDDCQLVTSDIADLSVLGLDRQISSVRPRVIGRPRGGLTPIQRPQIVLYDDFGFRGRATTIEDDTPTLRWRSDTAGSLRVISGRWEICDDVRYGGRCVIVTQDIPDLGRLGLRDRISSLRPR